MAAMRRESYLRPSCSACQATWSSKARRFMPCPAAYQRTRGWPGAAGDQRDELRVRHDLVPRPAWKNRCACACADPVERARRLAAAGRGSRPPSGARSSPARIAAVWAPSEKPTSPSSLRVDVAARGEQVERAPRVDDERPEGRGVVRLRDRHRHDAARRQLDRRQQEVLAVAAAAVQEEHGRGGGRARPRHDEERVDAPRAVERDDVHGGLRARERDAGVADGERTARGRRRTDPALAAARPQPASRTSAALDQHRDRIALSPRTSPRSTSPRSSPSACNGSGRSQRTTIRSRSWPETTSSASSWPLPRTM